MNFLTTPPIGLLPNGTMDEEQVAIAGEFVDELLSLKVLREAPPPGCTTVRNYFIYDTKGRATWIMEVYRQSVRGRTKLGGGHGPGVLTSSQLHPSAALHRKI